LRAGTDCRVVCRQMSCPSVVPEATDHAMAAFTRQMLAG
jgi:hypothetical protein